MTLRELADQILALTPDEQAQEAGVWPPGACPAAQVVPITGIGNLQTKADKVVILTGKKPS